MNGNKTFKSLSEADRLRTVFHVWIVFFDGKNPIWSNTELYDFYKRLSDVCARYGCYLMDGGVMDNHIHVVIYSPEGPLNISKVWKSINTSLTISARRKGIEGQIVSGGVRYKAILDPPGTVRVSRYIHANGKTDGHFVRGSLEHEFRTKRFRFVSAWAWHETTNLAPDDLKVISGASEEEMPALERRYAYAFSKCLHLYKVQKKKS